MNNIDYLKNVNFLIQILVLLLTLVEIVPAKRLQELLIGWRQKLSIRRLIQLRYFYGDITARTYNKWLKMDTMNFLIINIIV